MEKREFVCIGCPVGCELGVNIDGDTIIVSGNECKIGERYAVREITDPRRTISMAVKTELDGRKIMVSVKTAADIPKNMIFDCIKEIKRVSVKGEVRVGEVIIKNILDTGVDIIATSSNLYSLV